MLENRATGRIGQGLIPMTKGKISSQHVVRTSKTCLVLIQPGFTKITKFEFFHHTRAFYIDINSDSSLLDSSNILEGLSSHPYSEYLCGLRGVGIEGD